MKTILKLTLTLTLFFVCALFFSCEKLQDAKVTFFVSNAGTAGKWDHITITMAGKSQYFFTPERRNMVLGDCQEDANATTFYVPGGTYTYRSDDGRWQGNVTVANGDCQLVILQY